MHGFCMVIRYRRVSFVISLPAPRPICSVFRLLRTTDCTERRIATLTERGEMWVQYNKYEPIRRQHDKVKPAKRELFEQRHSRELIRYDAAARYLAEGTESH